MLKLLNVLLYVAMAYVMYQYIEPDRKRNNIMLLFIYLMLWFFMPTFGGEILWLTGSITYLWELLIVMAFGLVYYRACLTKEKKAISSGLALMAALFFFAVWSIRRKRRFRIWEITGIIGALAGFCVLMLAPGNFSRYSHVAVEAAERSVLFEYIYRIFRETYYAFYYLTFPTGVCIALTLLAPKTAKRKLLLFPVLAFISVYVMTFSNGFATRIFVTPLVLLTIGLGLAVNSIRTELGGVTQDRKRQKFSFAVIACTLVLVALTQYATGVLRGIQTGETMYKEIGYILQDTSISQGLMP